MMAGAGGELAVAHATQDPAQCLDTETNAKLRNGPLCQVDEPPAHHAVHRRFRTGLDDLLQSLTLFGIQQRSVARGLAVNEPWRTLGIERQHPVSDRLDSDTAGLRPLAAGSSVIERCQRQAAPGLAGILRRLCQRT